MYTPGALHTAASVLCLELSYLVCWLFKMGGALFPVAISRKLLELLIFIAPSVQSDVIGTHQTQGCPVWGLSSFSILVLPFLCVIGPPGDLVPNQVSTPPTLSTWPSL